MQYIMPYELLVLQRTNQPIFLLRSPILKVGKILLNMGYGQDRNHALYFWLFSWQHLLDCSRLYFQAIFRSSDWLYWKNIDPEVKRWTWLAVLISTLDNCLSIGLYETFSCYLLEEALIPFVIKEILDKAWTLLSNKSQLIPSETSIHVWSIALEKIVK